MTSTIVRFLASAAVIASLCANVHGQKPPTPRRSPATPAAQISPPVNRKVPFQPGETLTYDVGWSSYLTAGVATLSVKDLRPSEGSSAYYIVAEGKPTGLVSTLYTLYYKVDTLLDSRSLLPQRASIYSQEGSRRRTRLTQFDQGGQRADYEVKTPASVKASLTLPKYTQDALSALYALRAVPLRANAGFTMPVCDSGKLYRVRFSVGQVETIRSGAGQVPAFRVTPTIADSAGRSVGRPMTLWISADARQVPLKLQADLAVGSIVLTLRPSI